MTYNLAHQVEGIDSHIYIFSIVSNDFTVIVKKTIILILLF